VVEFIIDSAGHVTYPVVKKGLGFGCDEEASAVSLSPNGSQNQAEYLLLQE
jgi:hypothetical protein